MDGIAGVPATQEGACPRIVKNGNDASIVRVKNSLLLLFIISLIPDKIDVAMSGCFGCTNKSGYCVHRSFNNIRSLGEGCGEGGFCLNVKT